MNPIHRRLLVDAKRHAEEITGHLDALLEEPEESAAEQEPVHKDPFRTVFSALIRATHFGVLLTNEQAEYLARTVLTAEIDVNGIIFPLGHVAAYAERIEQESHHDSSRLKEQAIEIQRLKDAATEAKQKCPVCGGNMEIQIEDYSGAGGRPPVRKMIPCPAPVHSL